MSLCWKTSRWSLPACCKFCLSLLHTDTYRPQVCVSVCVCVCLCVCVRLGVANLMQTLERNTGMHCNMHCYNIAGSWFNNPRERNVSWSMPGWCRTTVPPISRLSGYCVVPHTLTPVHEFWTGMSTGRQRQSQVAPHCLALWLVDVAVFFHSVAKRRAKWSSFGLQCSRCLQKPGDLRSSAGTDNCLRKDILQLCIRSGRRIKTRLVALMCWTNCHWRDRKHVHYYVSHDMIFRDFHCCSMWWTCYTKQLLTSVCVGVCESEHWETSVHSCGKQSLFATRMFYSVCTHMQDHAWILIYQGQPPFADIPRTGMCLWGTEFELWNIQLEGFVTNLRWNGKINVAGWQMHQKLSRDIARFHFRLKMMLLINVTWVGNQHQKG